METQRKLIVQDITSFPEEVEKFAEMHLREIGRRLKWEGSYVVVSTQGKGLASLGNAAERIQPHNFPPGKKIVVFKEKRFYIFDYKQDNEQKSRKEI